MKSVMIVHNTFSRKGTLRSGLATSGSHVSSGEITFKNRIPMVRLFNRDVQQENVLSKRVCSNVLFLRILVVAWSGRCEVIQAVTGIHTIRTGDHAPPTDGTRRAYVHMLSRSHARVCPWYVGNDLISIHSSLTSLSSLSWMINLLPPSSVDIESHRMISSPPTSQSRRS